MGKQILTGHYTIWEMVSNGIRNAIRKKGKTM